MSTDLTLPLYEIEDELIALMESVETCPEELRAELDAKIEAYIGLERSKVDRVAQFLAVLEYAQKDGKDEIARLQERIKAAATAAERLEGYVIRVMQARGLKKLEGKNNTFSLRTSSGVIVTDSPIVPNRHKTANLKLPLDVWGWIVRELIALSPYELWRQVSELKPVETISLSSIKDAIKAGETVPGADLEFRDNLIRK